jgi:hypothetical protein
MIETIRRRGRSAALIGVAAALVGGGMALAADDGSGGANGASGQESPAPPPLPPPMENLTYAEFHIQHNGNAEVVRTDAGKVLSADQSGITLSENDGNEVTIPVDEDTRVAASPDKEGKISDLEQGDQVLVTGPKGEAADFIFVPPDESELRRAFHARGSGEGDVIPAPRGAPGAGLAIPLPPPGGGR